MKMILLSLVLVPAFSSAGLLQAADKPPTERVEKHQSSLSVSTVNGQTTVIYNAKEVFSGPTKGKVASRSVSRDGKNYAAAWEDDRVLWENVPGAAAMAK
ncbi:MAG: hypothetical protein EXS33_04935 [Pedosphaera sp.]|nr:hypothetical protein [Pedosphaera sp.]